MTMPTPVSPAAQLDLLADALGDPTRRAIFKYVAEAAEPVTAADVGLTFGIHRTVARAHLERLVETGLLQADFRHRPEGGRPPKVYSRSEQRLDLQLPVRQYEMLAELLLSTLEHFGDAAQVITEQVGFAFGRRLAALRPAVPGDSPVAALLEAGAELTLERHGDRVRVEVRECLFREVATRRPRLVCTLDRAVLRGLLSSTEGEVVLYEASRRNEHHDVCSLVYAKSPPPEKTPSLPAHANGGPA
ncbi:MAG: helix-turn-helix domain-containing protein [Actinobacteria bacterium]|nr:helix-turn-helix domain-containing protein [Actinomycetota bacterium]